MGRRWRNAWIASLAATTIFVQSVGAPESAAVVPSRYDWSYSSVTFEPVSFIPGYFVDSTPEPTRRHQQRWISDPEVSFYGPGFYGKRTACGLAYTTRILGVAHRTLPCGTLVVFRYNGKEITVPVIDRGPYVEGRTWDLSGGLCVYLGHCFTGPIEWRFP